MEALGTLDLYDLLILPVVAAMNYKIFYADETSKIRRAQATY